MIGALARMGDRVTDGANPMLVRTVRQQLRSRGFTIMFAVTLAFATVASLGVASNASGDEGAGAELFGILSALWAFAVWVFEPIAAYRAVSQEREETTWDLIRLTGLSPLRLMWGMLQASLVQGMMYTAAIAPFMVMAYLLRGVDLITIVVALILIPTAGAAASAGATLAGALGVNKAARGALGVLVAMGSLFIWFWSVGFWFGGRFLFAVMSIDVPWLALFAFVNFVAAWVALTLTCGAAAIRSPTGNRSTGPRAVCFLIAINLGLWFGLADVDDLDERMAVAGLFICLLAGLMGVFSTTEDRLLSPRQARWIRDSKWWWFPGLLGPGGARGKLAFVVLSLVGVGVTAVGYLDGRAIRMEEPMAVVSSVAAYAAIYLLATDLLSRHVMPRMTDTALARRTAFVMLLILMTLLAAILPALARTGDSFLHLISPIPGIGVLRDLEEGYAIILPLGAASMAILVIQALRDWKIKEVRTFSGRRKDPHPDLTGRTVEPASVGATGATGEDI